MSQTKSPNSTPDTIKNPFDGDQKRNEERDCDNESRNASSDYSRTDKSVRERILKEVGLTSTSFIGPAFPPEKNTVKLDIEDTLSEFYKELEQIDKPDFPNTTERQDTFSVQPNISRKASQRKEIPYVREEEYTDTDKWTETDGFQRGRGQKQASWPHWYQNEPYFTKKLRPDTNQSFRGASPSHNEHHYPRTLNRPPNTRFHTPPFHLPPPPSAFPHSPNLPPNVNPKWNDSGFTNQHPEESRFPATSNYPPPNVPSHTSQGFHIEPPHLSDRDDRFSYYGLQSDNGNVAWSAERKESWTPYSQDFDWRQKNDSENDQWERGCQPPYKRRDLHSPLVLILMRGLPGSGKSTLARELLCTGPSGLILSTDDYFDHREGYRYEAGLLGAAHEWNQRRAKDAMHDGRSPIIIDNTNIQAWEMKPYVIMALDSGYRVDFCEPDTRWKFDPSELEKRNKHGVPQDKIAQMMDRFSFPISVDVVMRSEEPLHVNQRRRPEPPHMIMRRNKEFH